MAKEKKGKSGLRTTSKVAMNKLKKSQNIAIMLMILVLIVGSSLMVFCYLYPSLDVTTPSTAEPGQNFKVNGLFGSAPVKISIETTAKEPPEFYIITEDNFRKISPDRTVPNKRQDPDAVKQIEFQSEVSQPGKKDFNWEGKLDNNDWFVIVVTNSTESGVQFNMIYDITVFSFRPLVLPVLFPIVLICEVLCFIYILILNSRLRKVQEKVSTQRLLKAQMDMVRNFILQSSGAAQPFSFSSSPYKAVSSEGIPRDAMPMAIASGEVEIVECYACNELITINSPERPLIVACPNCGVKSQVTHEEAEEEAAPGVKDTLPPVSADVKMLPAGNPPPETPSPVPVPSPVPANPTPEPTHETGGE